MTLLPALKLPGAVSTGWDGGVGEQTDRLENLEYVREAPLNAATYQ